MPRSRTPIAVRAIEMLMKKRAKIDERIRVLKSEENFILAQIVGSEKLHELAEEKLRARAARDA